MTFSISGSVHNDNAANAIDALRASGDGPHNAIRDALKVLLAGAFRHKAISVSTSGHLNEDGTGYLSVSLSAFNPAPVEPIEALVEPSQSDPVVEVKTAEQITAEIHTAADNLGVEAEPVAEPMAA